MNNSINQQNFRGQGAQRGFSLVELMVAVTLGLILSIALVQVFMGNRQVQEVEAALSRVQENGRFAIDMIARDVRLSGYHGCGDPEETVLPIDVQANGVDPTYYTQSIEGYVKPAGVWAPALDARHASINAETRNNSDVLSAYFAEETGATLTAVPGLTGNVAISAHPDTDCLVINEIVMLNNCKATNVFRLTGVPACNAAGNIAHGAGSNTSASFRALSTYAVGDTLLRFVENTYFVRDTGRDYLDGSPVYALYRMGFVDGIATIQEMIEGVEFLKVQYGQELATGNIRYVAAGDANLNMNEVVSVRIGLLIRSPNNTLETPDTNDYNLPGQVIGPNGVAHDGGLGLRRVFTTTVKLRNRSQDVATAL